VYSIAASRSRCLAVLPLMPMECTVWYMKPVRVSTDVPRAREDVWDFLGVLASRELFTGHMFRDWRCEGPGLLAGEPGSPSNPPGCESRPARLSPRRWSVPWSAAAASAPWSASPGNCGLTKPATPAAERGAVQKR
jgi:hypothetical protein